MKSAVYLCPKPWWEVICHVCNCPDGFEHPKKNRSWVRPPVLHLLLDGVPHHQDHGRGGQPDDRVPWQLQDRRQRPNCDVADHRPKSEAEVPAPHHQQLRAVQQVSKNHFNGWHHGVSKLDNHSLLAGCFDGAPALIAAMLSRWENEY